MTMFTQIIVLISLCLQINCQNDLFREGYSWKYSYNGYVTAGSVVGVEALSRWNLGALLEITTFNGIVLGQLHNLDTSLYNGPSNEVPENLHPTPVPDKAATSLSLPFIINYNGTNIDSIGVAQYDPLWSVNIKRGIASLLQLPLENLHLPASLITEENLYGTCENIEYSVENKTETIILKKYIDHTQCKNYPLHAWSSTPNFLCQKDIESPRMSNTIREYKITNADNKIEIIDIESKRRFYSQPHNAHGEAQQSFQYQRLKLLSTPVVQNDFKVPNNLVNKSIFYELNINDLTQERNKNDTDIQLSFMGAINTLLNDVVTNLDEKHLDKNILDFHRELMFLYYNFFLIEIESFHKFYDEYSSGTSLHQETKLSIFLEFLPQVGSENSVNFMKDLILKQKLKDPAIIKMLSIFPLYVKQHSEKLLSDMEVLLTLNHKYDQSVREASVLSFATLVYQTFIAGKCTVEAFENYALKYFNLFSESDNYAKKMLYLQGLDNLQLGSVPIYLKSIFTNKNHSRHIRFLAAWASTKSTLNLPDNVYETYWPIFSNTTESLELRVAAMLNLLYGQPTKSRLMALYWYLIAEGNPHMYNFFYTTIISLDKSNYPCFKKLASISQYLVRYIPVSETRKWATGNYILDYSDTERAFGALIHLTLIGNSESDNPNVIYFNVKNYASGLSMNQIAVYLKLEGLSSHFSDILNKIPFELGNLDEIVKMLNLFNFKSIPSEKVHIELVMKVYDKVVFCTYLDEKSLDQVKQAMKKAKLLIEYQLNHQSIVVPYTKEFIEPTDLGTILIKSVVSNSIASTRGSLVSETKNEKYIYNSNVDFRYYTYTISFLELYNPLSDMWHGVERGKKLQAKFLINGTLTVDKEGSEIEFIEGRNGEEYLSVLLHSHSYTYLVSNGTGALQHHCPKCSNLYNLTQGPVKDKIQLIDKHLDHNETKLQITIFDCDSYHEIKNIFRKLHSSHRGNTEIIPFASALLYVMHYSDYVSYIPCHGRCGVSLIIKPTTNDFTELKYTLSKLNTNSNTTKNNTNVMYSLSTKLHRGDNTELTNLWNATALWKWDSLEHSVTLFVSIDAEYNADNKQEIVCVSSGSNKEHINESRVSAHQTSVNTNLIVTWGHNDKVNEYPTCINVETAVNNFLRKVIKLLNDKLLKNV